MDNNYIVTTHSNHDQEHKLLTWKDLHEVQYTFNAPFSLRLADHEIFSADEVVRLIPGKRMVVFGQWQGRSVVAKLFFDPQRARRHMEQDVKGVKALLSNKIPSPELYYDGMSEDHRIYVLIYERIQHAKNLEDVWTQRNSLSEILPILSSVITELATQHVLGLVQHDLHMKNFLLTEKTIYTLDGAQIESFPTLLAKKPSMESLALFLSQLGIGVEDLQEELFRHYVKARGWLLHSEDVIELFHLIKKWHVQRWKKYEKKIFRNSTDYATIRGVNRFSIYDRHYAGNEFKRFLADPESVFHHPTAKFLKKGRSATVIKVTLDGHDLVVKRYNLKDKWHKLRRCLRTTRASVSWRLGQKMKLFGILTAKPIALIEQRYFCFRGISYFVSEYVPGMHAGDYFKQHKKNEDHNLMVTQIVALLKSVARLGITHGDLKITNILINEANQPVLIDLDGAAEHLTASGLHKAWDKELKRFLDNFQYQPHLAKNFAAALGIAKVN